jgi:hypothetical protein
VVEWVCTTEQTAKIFAQVWSKLSGTHITIIVVVLIIFTCGSRLAMIAFDAKDMRLIAKDWLFGNDVQCVPHGAHGGAMWYTRMLSLLCIWQGELARVH